jgi:hypothetical protein
VFLRRCMNHGIGREWKSDARARAGQIHKTYIDFAMSGARAAATQSRAEATKGCHVRGCMGNDGNYLIIRRRGQHGCSAVKNCGDSMIELLGCLTTGSAVRMGGMRRRRCDGLDIAFKDRGRRGVTVGEC